MSNPIAMSLLLLGLLFSSAPVLAGGQDALAERYRLETELDRHAGATRWKGVERTYQKLLELQVPLHTQAHYTAALAAESQGNVTQTWLRLERAIRHENALELPPDENGFSIAATVPEEVDLSSEAVQAATQTYNSLNSRYGRATISVAKGRLPALIRMGAKPFGSTERGAITIGQQILAESGRFVGLLPVGKYMVDGEMFEIESEKLVVVKVESR